MFFFCIYQLFLIITLVLFNVNIEAFTRLNVKSLKLRNIEDTNLYYNSNLGTPLLKNTYADYYNKNPYLKMIMNDNNDNDSSGESAFDKVASMGLAGILAITAAEAIFWAAGVPLADLYYKYTTGEWIDVTTADGQLKAAGFSFGYGGFATLILQYRVTIFAIPLVPIMQKYIVEPGKQLFGEQFGDKNDNDNDNL